VVWVCSKHGEIRNAHKIMVANLKGRHSGRPRRRWEDNIKIYLKTNACGRVEWIQLAHGRIQWRAVLYTIMKRRVS
jgi:hypothetical protein